MAQVTTFKKSIWRRIDEKSERIKSDCKKKTEEIKKALRDPANQEKIVTAAKWIAGCTILVLQVRKELRPTLADIERRQKLYSYYDPHSHIRFNTKRKVRPEVAYEISRRTAMGEDVVDILREKKLL